jgi:hypothetical protein
MGWVVPVITAISALQQYGQARNAALDREDEAKQAKDEALQHAELIRRAAKAQRAAAQAAFVGGGVDTGTGTPLTIDSSITNDSEYDAYNALLSGSRNARSLRQQANETRTQGAFNAASTLAGGYQYAKSGWKKSPGVDPGYGGTGYGGGVSISGATMNG